MNERGCGEKILQRGVEGRCGARSSTKALVICSACVARICVDGGGIGALVAHVERADREDGLR